MLSMSARAYRFSSIAVVLLVACFASEAAAQATAGAKGGKIHLTGGFDVLNASMFRGLRQDDTRVIMWPFVDAGIDLYSGDGGVKNAALHIGTWNSLHTGSTGLQGPNGKLWYESNVRGGVEFQSLGDTPEAFNGGEQQKIIGSIGIGFSC